MTPLDPAAVVAALAAPGAIPDPTLVPVPMGILQDVHRFLLGIEQFIDQILAIVFTILRIVYKIMWLFGGG